jgi:hypothetical protein
MRSLRHECRNMALSRNVAFMILCNPLSVCFPLPQSGAASPRSTLLHVSAINAYLENRLTYMINHEFRKSYTFETGDVKLIFKHGADFAPCCCYSATLNRNGEKDQKEET